MTEEQLKARIAELRDELSRLQASMDQLQANGNALSGALQECERWLMAINQSKTGASE